MYTRMMRVGERLKVGGGNISKQTFKMQSTFTNRSDNYLFWSNINKNYLLPMVTVENLSLSRRSWRLDKRVVFSRLLQESIQTSVLYRLLSGCASIQILSIQVKIMREAHLNATLILLPYLPAFLLKLLRFSF